MREAAMRLRRALTAGFAALLAVSLPMSTGSASDVSTTAIAPTHRSVAAATDRARDVLVWSQFVDLKFHAARIVASRLHGGQVRTLTHPARGIVDINPQISPDGRWVVFERDVKDTTRVVIVGIHGHRQHVVDLGCDDPCAGDNGPTWSPDGQHLLFERVTGPFSPDGNAVSAALYMADVDGQNVVRLSPDWIDDRGCEDQWAQFAPDGYVVFIRGCIGHQSTALYRMRADGTHQRRLTPWRINADIMDVSPATSGPTRNLVVFETYGHGEPPTGKVSAVAAVSAARKSDHHVRYLTSPTSVPVWNFNPTWSPDGKRVAFVRFKSVDSDPVVHGDIWTIRWDGTDRERVSHAKLFDFRPSWGRLPS
jgi:Tol biopolymer transport system component